MGNAEEYIGQRQNAREEEEKYQRVVTGCYGNGAILLHANRHQALQLHQVLSLHVGPFLSLFSAIIL